ncbi:MAG: sugar ABC transporter permease [Oscillospiraceae bacterium]|nr:sugar ABC transporter permease [Oscillospiraceae bacterium]
MTDKSGIYKLDSTWGRIKKGLMRSWQWYLLLLPGLIYLIIFNYFPMAGLQIAFKNYRASKGIWGSAWVGFEHFKRFFNYANMWKLIWNTLSITLLTLVFFPIPVIFALLLNEVRRPLVKKSVQMITYMPHFLSEVVVCSLVILFLQKDSGIINDVVEWFGGTRTNQLSVPEHFSWVYVIMNLWQNMGWNSILYISALSSISMDQVEAAKIDGASRFQIVKNVYIPGIMPTIIITFLMQVGRIMTIGYSKIYLLQNSLNLERSSVLSTYIYEIGILNGQFSYATAIGLFNNLVSIIILIIVNEIIKRSSEVSLF